MFDGAALFGSSAMAFLTRASYGTIVGRHAPHSPSNNVLTHATPRQSYLPFFIFAALHKMPLSIHWELNHLHVAG